MGPTSELFAPVRLVQERHYFFLKASLVAIKTRGAPRAQEFSVLRVRMIGNSFQRGSTALVQVPSRRQCLRRAIGLVREVPPPGPTIERCTPHDAVYATPSATSQPAPPFARAQLQLARVRRSY